MHLLAIRSLGDFREKAEHLGALYGGSFGIPSSVLRFRDRRLVDKVLILYEGFSHSLSLPTTAVVESASDVSPKWL